MNRSIGREKRERELQGKGRSGLFLFLNWSTTSRSAVREVMRWGLWERSSERWKEESSVLFVFVERKNVKKKRSHFFSSRRQLIKEKRQRPRLQRRPPLRPRRRQRPRLQRRPPLRPRRRQRKQKKMDLASQRPLPAQDLASVVPDPGRPRVDEAPSLEKPNPEKTPRNRSVLQAHAAFFDFDGDGVLSLSDTYKGMRSTGFNVLLAALGTAIIHASFSLPTTPPVEVRLPSFLNFSSFSRRHGRGTQSQQQQQNPAKPPALLAAPPGPFPARLHLQRAQGQARVRLRDLRHGGEVRIGKGLFCGKVAFFFPAVEKNEKNSLFSLSLFHNHHHPTGSCPSASRSASPSTRARETPPLLLPLLLPSR